MYTENFRFSLHTYSVEHDSDSFLIHDSDTSRRHISSYFYHDRTGRLWKTQKKFQKSQDKIHLLFENR